MVAKLSAVQEKFLQELFELCDRYKQSAGVSIVSLGTQKSVYWVAVEFYENAENRKEARSE